MHQSMAWLEAVQAIQWTRAIHLHGQVPSDTKEKIWPTRQNSVTGKVCKQCGLL